MREEMTSLSEGHDVFPKEDVATGDAGPGSEKINLVGPLIIAISSNPKDSCEFTVLAKANPLVFFGANICKASPSLEHPKIRVCPEEDEVCARGYHLLSRRRWRDGGC